jgi:hypothetical protein
MPATGGHTLVLVGGAPRVGKSPPAQRLLAADGIPWLLPTDVLRTVLRRALPELDALDQDPIDAWLLAEVMYPHVEQAAEVCAEEAGGGPAVPAGIGEAVGCRAGRGGRRADQAPSSGRLSCAPSGGQRGRAGKRLTRGSVRNPRCAWPLDEVASWAVGSSHCNDPTRLGPVCVPLVQVTEPAEPMQSSTAPSPCHPSTPSMSIARNHSLDSLTMGRAPCVG